MELTVRVVSSQIDVWVFTGKIMLIIATCFLVKFVTKTVHYDLCYCFVADVPNDNPTVLQLKNLASKVLFALSLNFFNAVFNRISGR